MKKFCALGIAIALMFFVSCGKQQTEAEKNAEIEHEVQQRLAAERQADEQQKLAQREADLKAREDALAQKEESASTPTATPQMRGSDIQQRDVTEGAQTTDADSGEPASYNTFYTKLEPYGAWRETSDYGYVWQPNESERSRNWRPYTNGRWVYTDAGWTWDSEEPFGWATYHYGRWARLRSVGWVWIPGDEWAPAWVSWRKSDDYVGWAPLPPEAHFDRGRGIHNWADNSYDIGPNQYCFVATNDFGAQRTERAIVPVERNVTIVSQTINVTNITYNNTTIVNEGPNYEELRKRTREPIQRLRLDRQQRFENENAHAVVRGEAIEMLAPAIVPARAAERPRAVKEKITKSDVDHGWADIRDKKAAEQARAKMKAEATAPSGAPPPKVSQAKTPEPAQPAETPVRNFPDRAKMKAHPSATVAPGVKMTPSPNASRPAQETKETERQMKEAQRAQKEKAAQQQKAEGLRKAKAAKNQPPSPTPAVRVSPRATPVAKPLPKATAAKTSPATSAAPRPTPVVKQPPAQTPPAANPAPNRTKKVDKEKGKNKRSRESPSPSPTASGR
jgi:hypothetical protein